MSPRPFSDAGPSGVLGGNLPNGRAVQNCEAPFVLDQGIAYFVLIDDLTRRTNPSTIVFFEQPGFSRVAVTSNVTFA
jgi:hypothetical protein